MISVLLLSDIEERSIDKPLHRWKDALAPLYFHYKVLAIILIILYWSAP